MNGAGITRELVIAGFFVSPETAQEFEKLCQKTIGAWDARSQLLGFHFAHQLCCPQFRSHRINNIIWTIDNTPEVPRWIRNYLLVESYSDGPYIARVRAAWQRRIDAAPNDSSTYLNMGTFLLSINPGEARPYYEKAIALGGDKEAIERFLETAKILEEQRANKDGHDHASEPRTCFFEVLQAGDKLLMETRERMKPNEADWAEFFDIAHQLIWNPQLHVYTQFGNNQAQSTASMICKESLRQMYKILDKNSEIGKALRKPKMRVLWKDLVKP